MATIVTGYIRLSKQEANANGHSLDAQEQAIRDACAARGWQLDNVVREVASARSLERPRLTSVLSRISSGKSSGLVVAKLDRLSRSVADFADLLEWFERAEAALWVLDMGIDTSTPAGELVANIMASVAQWERKTIAQRTRVALAERRRQGLPSGRGSVADHPELAQRIRRMRARGKTLQAIADKLNADGIPTLRGAAQWTPSSVKTTAGWKRRKPARQTTQLPALPRRRS